jgi:hypothetical protein
VAGHRYKIIASRRLLSAAFCNKIGQKQTHALQQKRLLNNLVSNQQKMARNCFI